MNKKCQVFTPYEKVIELLDKVGYTKNLYGKKVIENACGDGNILKEIVGRYILDSLNKNMDLYTIKIGLENDIYGAEIDKEHYENCIKNLEGIANKYNIFNVSWKILNTDILKEDLKVKFDYVIGNPPYITYRDLDLGTRIFLKEKYYVCTEGKFDYCYAFIEASINSLNDTGKLAYLIPNSIFKNVFAQKLREIISPCLTKIYDYTTEKLFSVLTSSAVIVIDKEKKQDFIEYHDIVNNRQYTINKCQLGCKWNFSEYISNTKVNTGKIKFSDYFTASISVATLFNKAFVLKNSNTNGNYITLNGFNIEKEVTRNAASPRLLNCGKKELIIFPYRYLNGKLIRYNEEEFQENYPQTVEYLKSFLDELKKRKSDKSSRWYEYGRSQALAHLNQEKLLLSTVVTKEVKVYHLDTETIPYSGIYITAKGKLPLSVAKNILQSEEFYNYVNGIGINANGISLRITPADINNYRFSL